MSGATLLKDDVSVAQRFADAVSGRDYDAMRSLLHADVRLRILLPGGLEEHEGTDAVVERFVDWLTMAEDLSGESSDARVVGDRIGLGWSCRLEGWSDPAMTGTHVFVHEGFCDVGDEGIEFLDLVCSGVRPEPAAPEARVHDFDAGVMGCTDGLQQEFRRRIRAVDVGDHLRVTAGDPSAKEDLPPLARMMGHAVLGIENAGQGRLVFTIERGK